MTDGPSSSPHEDVISSFVALKRASSLQADAVGFMTPAYWPVFGPPRPLFRDHTPTDDDLREHLLKSWTVDEVDTYFAALAARRVERARQEAWEATRRGRITIRWRKVRLEASYRVTAAWKVLRHGDDPDWSEPTW